MSMTRFCFITSGKLNMAAKLIKGAFAAMVAISSVSEKTAAFEAEPCTTHTSELPLPALAAFRPIQPTSYGAVAALFQVEVQALEAQNNIGLFSDDDIPAEEIIQVPLVCACQLRTNSRAAVIHYINAERQWTDYNALAQFIFRGLTNFSLLDQWNDFPTSLISPGQTLLVPIPCVGRNNRLGGASVIYMTYPARDGDTVDSVAADYNMSAEAVRLVNDLNATFEPFPGDVMAIPLSACTNNRLRVHATIGSYNITANGCVKCSCISDTPPRLDCRPSGACLIPPCAGTHLALGESIRRPDNSTCTCTYQGYDSMSQTIISKVVCTRRDG